MSAYGDWRISVFDRYGVYLTELDCPFNCIWSLNEVGIANMTISRYDEKCLRRYLEFGNHILFEHARLGDWGGIILPDDGRDWSGDGTITIRARSAEYNFYRRRAPLKDGAGKNGLYWGGRPGALFGRIIDHMNKRADTRVRKGRIDKGGLPLLIQLRMLQWSKHLEKIIARTNRRRGGDYWLAPSRDKSGRLIFVANFAQRRGRTEKYHLQEGVNIETPDGQFYREDGELINDMGVLASESDGTNYVAGFAQSAASQKLYGLFEGSDAITTDSPAQAEIVALARVTEKAYPRETFILVAIETPESPDTFKRIRVGDDISVHLFSVGFWYGLFGVDADVRITSVEYDTEENKAMLTVENI